MSWTRRSVLGALGALVAAPAVGATPPKRLVVVLADGGWDAWLTLDPRPEMVRERDQALVDGADETTSTYAGISFGSNPVSRPLTESFLARWASRAVVLRGVWSGAIGHEAALLRALTGTSTPGAPDLGAIVGSVLGHRHPVGYVDLSGRGMPGDLGGAMARVGVRQQLGWLLAPTEGAVDRAVADAWVRRRSSILRDGTAGGEAIADALVAARDRAGALRGAGADLVPGAWLKTDSTATLAADLLARDVCASVMLDSGQSWDFHERATGMNGSWEGLSDLLELLLTALDERGILDDTLVLVRSEMGRTPWRNPLGGTDHWPVGCALLLGGGLDGGRVVGATGDDHAALPVSLTTGLPDPAGEVISYGHLAAGVLAALGVDARLWLPDAPLGL